MSAVDEMVAKQNGEWTTKQTGNHAALSTLIKK